MKYRCLIALLSVVVAGNTNGHDPVKLIFDTDMASDCDDAGALAVLHALADRGEVEILAIVTNRKCPANSSAGAVDAINTWYGRPDISIGTDKDGAKTPAKWNRKSSYTEALRNEFLNDVSTDDEMPDALDVYLRTLRRQPDQSVVICSVGALSNLEDLVRADKQLVVDKVKELYIMGGGFPRTHRFETNIRLDPAAAVTVTNEWPTAVTWQGFEVGNAMISGSELVHAPETNPVRRAYELRPFRGGNSLKHGKPNHDLATVLLAVRGPEPEYWNVVSGGRVLVDSDGGTEWVTDRPKQHRYVVIKQHPRILTSIIGDLLAAPPKRSR